jgi:hypothetical protein
VQLQGSTRERLRELDAMLDELESLNLRGMSYLPVRVGAALIRLGITDPYAWSIPELIDRIFDLEEPLLATMRTRSAGRTAARAEAGGSRRR